MLSSNLKRNNLLLFFIVPAFLSACATSDYKVNAQSDNAIELLVSSDRVLVECESQEGYDGDIKDPHGFMMHVLDDKNTVLDLILPRVITGKDCAEHLKATTKILKNSSRVYIGSVGILNEPQSQSKFSYVFPGLGTFPGNNRILNYWAIWNDQTQCYDVIYGKEKPCPRDKFPLRTSDYKQSELKK